MEANNEIMTGGRFGGISPGWRKPCQARFLIFRDKGDPTRICKFKILSNESLPTHQPDFQIIFYLKMLSETQPLHCGIKRRHFSNIIFVFDVVMHIF